MLQFSFVLFDVSAQHLLRLLGFCRIAETRQEEVVAEVLFVEEKAIEKGLVTGFEAHLTVPQVLRTLKNHLWMHWMDQQGYWIVMVGTLDGDEIHTVDHGSLVWLHRVV